MANDEFDLLRNGPVPTPRDEAREARARCGAQRL